MLLETTFVGMGMVTDVKYLVFSLGSQAMTTKITVIQAVPLALLGSSVSLCFWLLCWHGAEI